MNAKAAPLLTEKTTAVITGREDLYAQMVERDSYEVSDMDIFWAAWYGREGILKRMVTTWGITPNVTDPLQRTPLHYAAVRGHSGAVQTLLDANADANAVNRQKQTALHLAAMEGRTAVVELLRVAGSDLNAQDQNGNTPLILALMSGHRETANSLLRLGADPAIKNNQNTSATDMVATQVTENSGVVRKHTRTPRM